MFSTLVQSVQNKSLAEDLEELKSDEPIFTSNSPHLENYEIIHYLGLTTEHTVLDHTTILSDLEDGHHEIDSDEEHEETPSEPYSLKTRLIYEKLAEKLKPHARKMRGNAIINIQFQMVPLPPPPFGQENPQFSLTCTGNVVRVVKRET